MFVNREKELKLLNDEYNSSSFKFSIIYGRRRVGKTTLIKKYIENKDSIYLLVTYESLNIVLDRLKEFVADFYDDDFLRDIEVKSFEQLFQYIAKQNFEKKLIIIIDEFQYLSKLDSSIVSQFQYIVDEILKDKNIHLILCGSIISMMYEQTLSYSSPLYGRRTSAIKLEALKFEYLSKFFKDKSQNELIELYSVLYGVPKYIEMFKDCEYIYDSINKNIIDKNSYLYDEPKFILQNEVNEPINYFTILEVIANGEHKIGNIAGKLNKNVQNITSFIAKLIELDIIYKDVPITEEQPHKSKKGLYFIKDNFFRFWFMYVLPNKSQLEIDNREVVLKKIEKSFSEYVSKTYEDICIEYTLKNYDIQKCGRWWNKSEEIDVVGVSEGYLVVGECKYSNKKVGIDILKKLKIKSALIDTKKPIGKYLLFSKSGFTGELINIAENNESIDLIEQLLERVTHC
jgi:AAA+ ATPase superfamily predicted ATPase